MPRFGTRSKENLRKCHPDLQLLFRIVVRSFDISITEGARSPYRQRQLVDRGLSKTMNSKHIPQADGWAHAVDLAPYPIDLSDTRKAQARFYQLSGYVRRIAEELGIRVRWGGDWDGDGEFTDQTFDDLMHWELLD